MKLEVNGHITNKVTHLIKELNRKKLGSGEVCHIRTLASRVYMTFHTHTKGYTVSGNQGTHDELNQIQRLI